MHGGAENEVSGICEQLLKITGDALLSDDFDKFAACFQLPYFIATSDHKASIDTPEAFRELFDRTICDFRLKGVTDLVRVCESSEYRSETQIGSTHVTHLMCAAQRITDPYPTFSTIELIDGEWKITSSQYALDKNMAVGAALNALNANAPAKQT